jgi:hypothetical protein
MKICHHSPDDRGVALPMALMMMALLTTLMLALAVLATSEPGIASNQQATAQARTMAESGLERALWALTAGQDPVPPAGALVLQGGGYLLPNPVPAPYDGSTFVAVNSTGGFKVIVANGAQPNQKLVTAVGYAPTATTPSAVRKVQVTVTRVSWINPLCGLCAGGESPPPPAPTTTVQVGGSATVNGAGPTCAGVTPTAAVASTGTVTTNGNPTLTPPGGGSGTLNNASFPSTMSLSNSDFATLKAMAQNTGHYYKGNQNWTSPPPNGLIVVDTPSGNPLTNSSPASDLITVDISGNWAAGWSGWLIVAGTISIHGSITMNGLIYAQNDINLHGVGGGGLTGAVISANRVNTQSSNLDVDLGNMQITYNCPVVRNGGGQLSQNWFVMPGTYKEVSGRTLP